MIRSPANKMLKERQMTFATVRRISLMIPALAVTFGVAGMNSAIAQPKTAAGTTKAKTERPKSKTLMGTFSQADATAVKIKGKTEEVSYSLVPSTVYWRAQRGVSPADLKVGETVRMNLPGTDDVARVESLSPLTFKFGEDATLIYGQPARMKFERITKITATDIVVGQTGKVAGNVYPDGRIEAREVWVEVEPEKKNTKKE
jgi:hypothetical protein